MTAAAARPVSAHLDPTGTVSAAMADALRHGEIGLQISAYRHGRPIVDVVAGWTDRDRRDPVTADSLFPVFSVTKGIVAALALYALGEGAIRLDTRISSLWPQFAVSGKAEVTFEHALTHAAGVPQMPAGVTPEIMCDWDEMCRRVAALEPLWVPGTRVGYHSYTFGWIVGETLRRALDTPLSVGELVRRHILEPSGARDFWIGAPPETHRRIVTLHKDPRPAGSGDSLAERAIPPGLPTGQDVFGRPDVRASCHPAAGGIGTARSLAAVFAMLAANGQLGPTAVLDPDWVRASARAYRDEPDLVIGERLAKGLGYYVSSSANREQGPPFEYDQSTLGHPGSGGSIAWADRRLQVGFAITRNHMSTAGWHDPVMQELITTVRAAVLSLGSGL